MILTEITPTFYLPPHLTNIAARLIIRLLVYEDYQDCSFYKWDPVRIWEFETHQPKKKKNKKINSLDLSSSVDNSVYGHPPPPWKELKKFRNWWCDDSLEILGHLVGSPIRQHIINALEKQSWTSQSAEEDILFLLLRLCMDTHIHFSCKTLLPLRSDWFQDLALIIDKLGPFPLQKLTVGDDLFQGNPIILSSIIRNSPNLQVLRIGQWELHSDILISLGGHCPQLLELRIDGMEPDIFMSDDAFFKCFFSGLGREEVFECHRRGATPQLSFHSLKYVDLLFCKQTEKLIQMLSYFYRNISLSAVDACVDDCILVAPFEQVGSQMPYLRISTNTKGLLDGRLKPVVKHASYLKEMRIHIDDNFPGADCDSLYKTRIEIASSNLKELLGQVGTIDSLVLRPHDGVDMAMVTLATFSAYGNNLKSLHFVYDFSPVSTNTLYQLLNLSPLLERLILDISARVGDSASRAFSTQLNEHPTLETFVIQDIQSEVEDDEYGDGELVCLKIASTVLAKSPNLRNLALHLEENMEGCFNLTSKSVERLHFSVADEYSSQWLSQILPNFPNLQILSLDGRHQSLWEERLHRLSQSSVNVTKKKPEFANILCWEKKSFSSGQPLVIMVM